MLFSIKITLHKIIIFTVCLIQKSSLAEHKSILNVYIYIQY